MAPTRSRRADDPWQKGDSHRWGLAREVEWLGAQANPAVLRGYLAALRRRFVGFEGAPLTADERDAMREAAETRLRDLESG